AEDLARLVALDALGPEVPGRDVPAGVEHEQRVVADALDHEPEQLVILGVEAPTLRRPAAVPGPGLARGHVCPVRVIGRDDSRALTRCPDELPARPPVACDRALPAGQVASSDRELRGRWRCRPDLNRGMTVLPD